MNALLTFLLLSTVTLFWSCNRTAPAANTATGVVNQTAAGPRPGSDPAEEIMSIARKLLDQPSYRARMETVDEPEQISEVEFVAPDRVRASTRDAEQISIGGDRYTKLFGVWSKPAKGNSRLSSGREEFESIVKFGPTSLSNAGLAGKELVMNKSALAYSYTIKREVPPLEYDVRLVVSRADGLPVKMEINYRNGPRNLKNKKKVTTFSDYGADISIDPPQPK